MPPGLEVDSPGGISRARQQVRSGPGSGSGGPFRRCDSGSRTRWAQVAPRGRWRWLQSWATGCAARGCRMAGEGVLPGDDTPTVTLSMGMGGQVVSALLPMMTKGGKVAGGLSEQRGCGLHRGTQSSRILRVPVGRRCWPGRLRAGWNSGDPPSQLWLEQRWQVWERPSRQRPPKVGHSTPPGFLQRRSH